MHIGKDIENPAAKTKYTHAKYLSGGAPTTSAQNIWRDITIKPTHFNIVFTILMVLSFSLQDIFYYRYIIIHL